MDEACLPIQDLLFIEGELDVRLGSDLDWESTYCHLDNCELMVFPNSETTDPLKVVPIGPNTTIETDGTPNALFFDIFNSGEFVLGVCAVDPGVSHRWLQVLRAITVPQPHRSLADFRVLAVLGRDSLTKVVLAEDVQTSERLVLKSVRKRGLSDSKRSRAVLAERNILMLIMNPFVVQLKCAFQTPSKFYLGLEYAAGGSLAAHLAQVRTIPDLDARLYVAEIAIALAHLHGVGVIYRDLTPGHVLFDAEGHVKLSDFSGAKAAADPDNVVATSIVGVHTYRAPEILGGTGYSVGVDWWALGILFCEMVAGVNPFAAETPDEFAANLVHGQPNIPAGVEPNSRAVIEGLLRKVPTERFGLEQLAESPLFAGFDWEHLSERRYKPRWRPPAPEPIEATERREPMSGSLESMETPGRDSMTVEGFSYVAPFEENQPGGEHVLLDMALLEEYETLSRDLE
jgi:serine/threonine protein kinase